MKDHIASTLTATLTGPIIYIYIYIYIYISVCVCVCARARLPFRLNRV